MCPTEQHVVELAAAAAIGAVNRCPVLRVQREAGRVAQLRMLGRDRLVEVARRAPRGDGEPVAVQRLHCHRVRAAIDGGAPATVPPVELRLPEEVNRPCSNIGSHRSASTNQHQIRMGAK